MNVQITHIIVHTPEQVREIIREARVIASENSEIDAEWTLYFNEACRLLGQRFTFTAMPQQVAGPLDLAGLRNRH